jgi:hypothetical protein
VCWLVFPTRVLCTCNSVAGLALRLDNSLCLNPGNGIEFVTTYHLNCSYELLSVAAAPDVHKKDILSEKVLLVAIEEPASFVQYFNYFTQNILADMCHAHSLFHAGKRKDQLVSAMSGHTCVSLCRRWMV